MLDGDIVVVGTDGLWDNMHKKAIVEMIEPFLRGSNKYLQDPTHVAEMLANQAEKLSYLQQYLSPFAEGARKHSFNYMGGKPDDITVIVGQVMIASKETKEE